MAIQHLGRWASSAVLSYIEEALAELSHGGRRLEESADDWEAPLASLADRLQAVETIISKRAAEAPRAVEPPPPVLVEAELERRWLISDTGKLHREASRSDDAPAYTWLTGCGWAFGRSWGHRFASAAEVSEFSGSVCAGGCDMGC